MSPAEVDAFLDRCGQMVIGAIGADGWPSGTLAATSYEAGTLRIRFRPGDPLLADLARDPHLCCVADEHESYFEIRGVIVLGRATAAERIETDVDVQRIISFDFGRLSGGS